MGWPKFCSDSFDKGEALHHHVVDNSYLVRAPVEATGKSFPFNLSDCQILIILSTGPDRQSVSKLGPDSLFERSMLRQSNLIIPIYPRGTAFPKNPDDFLVSLGVRPD